MKNRLLAVMALFGAMFLSMSVYSWDDPELTFVDPNLTEDSSGGGEYILYHVYSGKFMNDGNWTYSWNSQIVVVDSGLVVTLTWGQDYELCRRETTDAEYNDGYGWRMTMFEGNGSTSTSYFCELYLYNAECICSDHNAQGHMLWQFESLGNQVYKIKISDTDPTYGAGTDYANTYLGVDPDDIGVYPLTDVETAGYEDYQCEWKFVEPSVYEIYYAKMQLKEQLETADEAGYTDYATYAALYTSSSATADEILKAAEDLQADVLTYQYSEASASNPIDVTALIQNADLSSTTGWTVSRANTNGNFSQKTSSTTITFADGSTESDFDWYFYERWYWTTTGDWYVEQDLSGLPRGKYSLSCYSFTNNTEDDGGLFLRATVNGVATQVENTTSCPSDYSAYASYMEIEFSVISGEATIGFYSENCNSGWTGAGGFTLKYYGTEGAETMADLLQQVIDEAEDTYAEYVAANVSMSNAVVEEYEEVLATAKAAVTDSSLSDDELTEIVVALQTALADMETDIEAYETLITTINELYDEWDNSGIEGEGDIFNDYETFLYDLEDQYNAGTFDSDKIDSVSIWAEELWKQCILSAVSDGLTDDLTLLIENPDFDDSTNGWTVETGSLAVSYSCGEVYWSAFDFYQELTGLPVGSYKITAQAFYRPSWNSTCDAEGADNTVLVYLYGNDASTKIAHCYDYTLEEAYDSSNDYQLTVYGNVGEYAANNMYCAAYLFSLGYFENSVVCYVSDDGYLKLGLNMPDDTNAQDANWTIFDTFTLTYLGADNVEGASYALESLIERAQEYLDDTETLTTTEAVEALNTAIENANAVLNNLTLEVYTAQVEALNAAIETAVEAISAAATFETLAWTYIDNFSDAIYDEYQGTSEFDDFEELVYNMEDYVNGDLELENIAHIEELTYQLNRAYGLMVGAGIDLSGASSDSPIDVTSVLLCPSFSSTNEDGEEEADMTGWTSNTGVSVISTMCYEFYNVEGADVYQTTYALKSGYYVLNYYGFYRAGSAVNAAIAHRDGTEALNAVAYVKTDAGTWSNELPSIFECVQEFKYNSSCLVMADSLFPDLSNLLYKVIVNTTAGAILAFEDGYYQGEIAFYVDEDNSAVTIGVAKDELISTDWTMMDDFTLTCYGSDVPEGFETAIETISDQATSTVVSSKWYTVNGVQVATPSARGIYIRVDALSDGLNKVAKVLIP